MRVEKDLLGEKEVPDEVYYGIQTVRAVENFPISGYNLRRELIIALAQVKKACAVTNFKLDLLDLNVAEAIIKASEEIIDGKLHEQFAVDPIQGGAGTSINMNANEVIANRALELLGKKKGSYKIISPNTHVNKSQSTNDVFPTAIRIAALMLGDRLLLALKLLISALEKKAMEFDHVIKVARTHLQDAIPIRLGQEFSSYQQVLERDEKRIRTGLKSLLEINLGATAAGTGLNSPQNYVKTIVEELKLLTGYNVHTAENLVDATQNIDCLVETSFSLKTLAVNLSKIANDLRLLSSGPRAGLNEINLPPVQPGSSIMPGKVNPVIPELINQVAFHVVGNDLTITMAHEAGQLELNVMEPIVAHNLFESFYILTNAIEIFAQKTVVGITVNEEICAKYYRENLGLLTALTPHLGYEQTSALARETIKSNRTVQEMVLDKDIMSEADLKKVLSVDNLIKADNHAGHKSDQIKD